MANTWSLKLQIEPRSATTAMIWSLLITFLISLLTLPLLILTPDCSTPSVFSLKKAMQTYARQGGTSTIFVHDDGLQLLNEEEREKRIAFYADHNIGWVARPPHSSSADGYGYNRAGRFKKASNMNYGLQVSNPSSNSSYYLLGLFYNFLFYYLFSYLYVWKSTSLHSNLQVLHPTWTMTISRIKHWKWPLMKYIKLTGGNGSHGLRMLGR